MQNQALSEITSFIDQAKIPRVAFAGRTRAGEKPRELNPQATSVLVGSDILMFSDRLPALRRAAILNCALLSQLVAKDRVPDASDWEKWFEVYFESLMRLGWAVSGRSFGTHAASGEEFSVHQAILELVGSFLGEASSAYQLVKGTLDALRALKDKENWISIFDREFHSLKSAKFQIGVVGDDLNVALMAFAMESTTKITSVLFFKARSAEVTFHQRRGNTVLDGAMLDKIGPLLQRKLAADAMDYIRDLPPLTKNHS
jgi:hypothetical protein